MKIRSNTRRNLIAITDVELPIFNPTHQAWRTEVDVYETLYKSRNLRKFLLKKGAMMLTSRFRVILLTHDLITIPLVLSSEETEEDLHFRVRSRLVGIHLATMGRRSETSDSFARMFGSK